MIRGVDMSPEMIEECIKVAREAFRSIPTTTHSHERDRAKLMKQKLDATFGATWHCIVGRDFGSFVSHETKHYINFYLEDFSVLLFKAG
jgi:dynein light chain LC8-type